MELPLSGSCDICGIISTLRCSACKKAFFCGTLHQKEGWPVHKENCVSKLERRNLKNLKKAANENTNINIKSNSSQINKNEEKLKNIKQETKKSVKDPQGVKASQQGRKNLKESNNVNKNQENLTSKDSKIQSNKKKEINSDNEDNKKNINSKQNKLSKSKKSESDSSNTKINQSKKKNEAQSLINVEVSQQKDIDSKTANNSKNIEKQKQVSIKKTNTIESKTESSAKNQSCEPTDCSQNLDIKYQLDKNEVTVTKKTEDKSLISEAIQKDSISNANLKNDDKATKEQKKVNNKEKKEGKTSENQTIGTTNTKSKIMKTEKVEEPLSQMKKSDSIKTDLKNKVEVSKKEKLETPPKENKEVKANDSKPITKENSKNEIKIVEVKKQDSTLSEPKEKLGDTVFKEKKTPLKKEETSPKLKENSKGERKTQNNQEIKNKNDLKTDEKNIQSTNQELIKKVEVTKKEKLETFPTENKPIKDTDLKVTKENTKKEIKIDELKKQDSVLSEKSEVVEETSPKQEKISKIEQKDYPEVEKKNDSKFDKKQTQITSSDSKNKGEIPKNEKLETQSRGSKGVKDSDSKPITKVNTKNELKIGEVIKDSRMSEFKGKTEESVLEEKKSPLKTEETSAKLKDNSKIEEKTEIKNKKDAKADKKQVQLINQDLKSKGEDQKKAKLETLPKGNTQVKDSDSKAIKKENIKNEIKIGVTKKQDSALGEPKGKTEDIVSEEKTQDNQEAKNMNDSKTDKKQIQTTNQDSKNKGQVPKKEKLETLSKENKQVKDNDSKPVTKVNTKNEINIVEIKKDSELSESKGKTEDTPVPIVEEKKSSFKTEEKKSQDNIESTGDALKHQSANKDSKIKTEILKKAKLDTSPKDSKQIKDSDSKLVTKENITNEKEKKDSTLNEPKVKEDTRIVENKKDSTKNETKLKNTKVERKTEDNQEVKNKNEVKSDKKEILSPNQDVVDLRNKGKVAKKDKLETLPIENKDIKEGDLKPVMKENSENELKVGEVKKQFSTLSESKEKTGDPVFKEKKTPLKKEETSPKIMEDQKNTQKAQDNQEDKNKNYLKAVKNQIQSTNQNLEGKSLCDENTPQKEKLSEKRSENEKTTLDSNDKQQNTSQVAKNPRNQIQKSSETSRIDEKIDSPQTEGKLLKALKDKDIVRKSHEDLTKIKKENSKELKVSKKDKNKNDKIESDNKDNESPGIVPENTIKDMKKEEYQQKLVKHEDTNKHQLSDSKCKLENIEKVKSSEISEKDQKNTTQNVQKGENKQQKQQKKATKNQSEEKNIQFETNEREKKSNQENQGETSKNKILIKDKIESSGETDKQINSGSLDNIKNKPIQDVTDEKLKLTKNPNELSSFSTKEEKKIICRNNETPSELSESLIKSKGINLPTIPKNKDQKEGKEKSQAGNIPCSPQSTDNIISEKEQISQSQIENKDFQDRESIKKSEHSKIEKKSHQKKNETKINKKSDITKSTNESIKQENKSTNKQNIETKECLNNYSKESSKAIKSDSLQSDKVIEESRPKNYECSKESKEIKTDKESDKPVVIAQSLKCTEEISESKSESNISPQQKLEEIKSDEKKDQVYSLKSEIKKDEKTISASSENSSKQQQTKSTSKSQMKSKIKTNTNNSPLLTEISLENSNITKTGVENENVLKNKQDLSKIECNKEKTEKNKNIFDKNENKEKLLESTASCSKSEEQLKNYNSKAKIEENLKNLEKQITHDVASGKMKKQSEKQLPIVKVETTTIQPKEQNDKICFEIRNSERIGRYTVATCDIEVNEIIVKEEPLVIGPKMATVPVCLGCHERLINTAVPCSANCGWLMCAANCPHSHLHAAECNAMRAAGFKCAPVDAAYSCITPLRCLLLCRSDPTRFAQLLSLESHIEIRARTPLYQMLKATLGSFLHEKLKLKEFDMDLILRIAAILDTNCFDVHERPGLIARAIYPNAAMLGHDCTPNTKHSFTSNHEIVLVATRSIKTDEPITVSYTNELLSTKQRRRHLLATKCFICSCDRCRDPTEFGTYLGSCRCTVPECTGYLVSTDPLNDASAWKCEKCPNQLPAEAIANVEALVDKHLAQIDKNSVPVLEQAIALCKKLNAPKYQEIGIKLKIVLLLRRNRDESSTNEKIQKKQYLEELFQLVNKIGADSSQIKSMLANENK